MNEYIVAEVSKTWNEDSDAVTLAEKFEHVIAVNGARGYRLHSFRFSQVMTLPRELTETIIAVFRRIETPDEYRERKARRDEKPAEPAAVAVEPLGDAPDGPRLADWRNVMIREVGSVSSFRCRCGCNVFARLEPLRYECNSCKALYIGVKEHAEKPGTDGADKLPEPG